MSHCEGCPFMSCHDCEYQGGTEPGEVVPQPDSGGVEGSAQRANGAVVWEDRSGPRSPLRQQRRAVRGPSPTEAAKPHDWTYQAW